MTYPISLLSVVDKNKIASGEAWVVLLDVSVINELDQVVEVLSLANYPEDVVVRGKTYFSAMFDIELKQEVGALPEITLSINDYSRAIQARMQEYNGGVGSSVTVTVVTTADLSSPPEIQEFFTVIGAKANNYMALFTLGAENPLRLQFPRRRQIRDFCAWRYKSAECGYTGNKPTCDLTLQGDNGCEAHQNSARFGGFPGLNSRNFRYT